MHLDVQLGSLFVQGICGALVCPAPAPFRVVFALAVAFTRRALCVCVRLVGNTPKGRFRMAEPGGGRGG